MPTEQLLPASREVNLHDPRLYINRELSWLEFNQRVLDQAIGDDHPLLERAKFLAIVSSNLDEFYMVRVATLMRDVRNGEHSESVDGMTPAQQLTAMRARVASLRHDQAACWSEKLRPALAAEGIHFLEPDEYSDRHKQFMTLYFRSEIFPLLTPLAFDPGHPFPLISNKSKNFAVVVRHQRRTKFARVKIPPMLPRFVELPHDLGAGKNGRTYAFLEDVIRLNLKELFNGVEVLGAHLFRIIRDTDMEVPHATGEDDLMETVDRSLKQLRHKPPSLLQVEASMPKRVLRVLVENFEIQEDIVERTTSRMDFAEWMSLCKLPLAHLKDAPATPRTIWNSSDNVFDEIRAQDYLVHLPYESFSAVETFIQQAATDPQVAGIKMTLYRVGSNSPLVDMLIQAADSGKQVAVLVELKARFDERNNIEWATRMEKAGVHVVYGVENLKTHCKLCLVVRREADGVRRYAHIGTGNYNRSTAQMYTDLGLFTANEVILDDVAEVFNYLTGYSRCQDYGELLVAPVTLRKRLLSLIDREVQHAKAGQPARLIIKCNAITDPQVARALYRASQSGVHVDLIVRGICVLRPGLPGVSERITLRSVVGRFLEHSRIYSFENGGRPEVYLGSADLMERNLDRRVETLVRIIDPDIVEHLRDVVIAAYMQDNQRSYRLIDDRYHRPECPAGETPVNAQHLFLERYGIAPSTQPLEDDDTYDLGE